MNNNDLQFCMIDCDTLIEKIERLKDILRLTGGKPKALLDNQMSLIANTFSHLTILTDTDPLRLEENKYERKPNTHR